MIIVYLSIAVVIAALVYLAAAAVKTFKDMKPALERMNEISVRIQGKMDLIKEETNQLNAVQKEITEDIEFKKESVQYTVDTVKAVPESCKQIWQAVRGKAVRHPSVSVFGRDERK